MTSTALLDRLEAQLGELVARHRDTRSLDDFSRYADDPLGFIRDVLRGDPWSKQLEVAGAVRDHPLVTVRGCNGSGKDWTAAHLALWWVYARGGLVLVTGPTERQVKEIVMVEVARAFRRAADLPGELYQLALRVPGADHAGILAFTSNDSSKLTGHHAPRVLAIITEAQGVDPLAWEGLLSCTTGADDRVMAVGNPLAPTGRFYETHRPGSKWHRIRISASDHPNLSGGPFIPGGVTREFVDRMASEYGTTSPIYVARVLGDFPDTAEDGLVTLAWLERAARLHVCHDWDFDARALHERAAKARATVSLDVARLGGDSTVLCFRRGPVVDGFVRLPADDLMATTGRVIEALRQRGLSPRRTAVVWSDGPSDSWSRSGWRRVSVGERWELLVDVNGLGAGVADRLKEQGYPVTEFNSGSKARDADRHLNKRAEAYMTMRRLLETGDLAVPHDEQLAEELVTTTWRVTSSGKVQIIAKDDLRATLGRSPDLADALAMCVWPEVGGGVPACRPVRWN